MTRAGSPPTTNRPCRRSPTDAVKTHTDAGLATVLRADDLDAHPELPDGWSRSMGKLIQYGGPWPCRNCGGPSYLFYRCSKCGTDLTSPG